MDNRWGWGAMIVATALVAACETTTTRSPEQARLLTAVEMDQVSAGSAAARSNVEATALGPSPHTSATTSTLASSGSPVSAPPFLDLLTLNYAFSQALASAIDAPLTDASGSTQTEVDNGTGGASISATSVGTAAGSASSHAQINMQFYGFSIGRVDLVFGTTIATACCAPILEAKTSADGTGGGYWRELQASPVSDVPGQVESRVDISVVSSALPILDAGLVSALVGPTWWQTNNQ
jgi:hypothetical protein